MSVPGDCKRKVPHVGRSQYGTAHRPKRWHALGGRAGNMGFILLKPWRRESGVSELLTQNRELLKQMQAEPAAVRWPSPHLSSRCPPLAASCRSSTIAAGVIIRVDWCCFRERSCLSPVTRNSAWLASASASR